MSTRGGRKNGSQVEQAPAAESNDVKGGAAIDAEVEKARMQVAGAEKSLRPPDQREKQIRHRFSCCGHSKRSKSPISQMELYKSNLWIADQQKEVLGEGHDEAKSLRDRIKSLEKDAWGMKRRKRQR